MQKAITYLYPDADNAANLKMFQDRTNQIRAFYFTRESYSQIYNLDFSSNYAIYFLFDDSENEKVKIVEGKIITQVNLAFKSPSAPADLITGLSENGWKFFKGLEELRNN